jgi:hypothetical protein
LKRKKIQAVFILIVFLLTVTAIAAPPPPVGSSNHVPLNMNATVKPLMADLSIDSISLNKPIKEGDTVGVSLVTTRIKNVGPGSVNDFTVKITCHAIRGTVPPGLSVMEKKYAQLLPVNGQLDIIWPSPSSAKWGVGDYRILVEVKSDREKNPQDNAKYFVFKIAPAVPTAIKVTSPNGGEVLYKGKTYNVTWTYTGNPNVPVNVVLLSSNDISKMYLIGDKVPLGQNGAGSFSWTIPANIERRSDYKMFVGNGSYTVDFLDSSDGNFSVSEVVN